jgi:hypothetical protein
MITRRSAAVLSLFLGLSLVVLSCAGPGVRISGKTRIQGAPPPGLPLQRTPQFVCVSSDDNGRSGLLGSGSDGGLHYITELFAGLRNPAGAGDPQTFDGTAPHYTFFVNTFYIAVAGADQNRPGRTGRENPVFIKRAWREAVERGHEIGVHTHSHPHGRAFTVDQWEAEMRRSTEILTRPWNAAEKPANPDPASGLGVARADLLGFRAPFIEPSDNGMAAAHRMGFAYDSSIEEGPGLGPHRGAFAWPYTLDRGIPDNHPAIGHYPGLWEIPIYNFIVPPDSVCPRYGVPAGLRDKMKRAQAYFQPENGEITGMDWNLWLEFSMTPAEFAATLEYTLDRHLEGNRCPMTVGLHSELYTVTPEKKSDEAAILARRSALEKFLACALRKPEVRLVSQRELLGWLRHPLPLR